MKWKRSATPSTTCCKGGDDDETTQAVQRAALCGYAPPAQGDGLHPRRRLYSDIPAAADYIRVQRLKQRIDRR